MNVNFNAVVETLHSELQISHFQDKADFRPSYCLLGCVANATENLSPGLLPIQYEQYWKERSIQIERFLSYFLECFMHMLLVENGEGFFASEQILRFPIHHRRIIMVRGPTIGRCACLAKRKAKKSAKKKAKRSVKKKQVKLKKKTVESAPKGTMPESPPPMPTESPAPLVEPAPSQTPSESETGTSS